MRPQAASSMLLAGLALAAVGFSYRKELLTVAKTVCKYPV